MLVLTRETGQPVRAADGTALGRLRDLTVRIGPDHPPVHRLALGSRSQTTHLLPWGAVAEFARSGVRLRERGSLDGFAVRPDASGLEGGELLLVRDVLDTQVVDVVGHRLARVADVIMARRPDDRLEVVAVDVGIGAVLRRLGLARLGKRLPEEAVDWHDLHLTSDRGHEVQLGTTAAAVHRLDDHALAELLTRLDLDSATDVIAVVGPERAAGAVARAHPVVGDRLILALHPDDAARVIEAMPESSGHRFRHVLGSRSPLSRRRFSRHRGWRHHRPPVAPEGPASHPEGSGPAGSGGPVGG